MSGRVPRGRSVPPSQRGRGRGPAPRNAGISLPPTGGRRRSPSPDDDQVQFLTAEDASAIIFCMASSNLLIDCFNEVQMNPDFKGFGVYVQLLRMYTTAIDVLDDFTKVMFEQQYNSDRDIFPRFADYIVSAKLRPSEFLESLAEPETDNIKYYLKFILGELKVLFQSIGLQAPFAFEKQEIMPCTTCSTSVFKVKSKECFCFTGSLENSLLASVTVLPKFCGQCQGIRSHHHTINLKSPPTIFYRLSSATRIPEHFAITCIDGEEASVRHLYALVLKADGGLIACVRCTSCWIKLSNFEVTWIDDIHSVAGIPIILFYGDPACLRHLKVASVTEAEWIDKMVIDEED